MAHDPDDHAAVGNRDAGVDTMKGGLRDLYDEVMGTDPFAALKDSGVKDQAEALNAEGPGQIQRMEKLLFLMNTRAGGAWATDLQAAE